MRKTWVVAIFIVLPALAVVWGIIADSVGFGNSDRMPEGPANIEEATSTENVFEINPAENSNLFLPDLRLEPTKNIYIESQPAGKRVLRFSTAVGNVGFGPLEMVGAYDEITGRIGAAQRIGRKEGGFEERAVGYFVFHEDHNHWHFEDFIEYSIYSVGFDGLPEKELVTTGKMTFCLYDYFKIYPPIPGTAENPAYPECDPVLQGISKGWADEYAADTSGQALDISNIGDGEYIILTTVDPLDRILEVNDDNNRVATRIRIIGNTAGIIVSTQGKTSIYDPPVDWWRERVTKKPFGIKISPSTSPVQPELYSGYHTGTDFEIFPQEAGREVQVRAICEGPLILKRNATGYGGVVVQSCRLEEQAVTVIYGHLKLASIESQIGKNIAFGASIGLLGEGESDETDGERKHLHLGVHKGGMINLTGYVQTASELDNWLDAEQILGSQK